MAGSQVPKGLVRGVFLALLCSAAAHAADSTTPPAVPHGTFVAVGNTTTPRRLSTATLLKDGTVLVTGGWEVSGANVVSQETAELFHPKTNTFSPTGSMTYPRTSHAAVRLQDGRVLIVGGSNDNFVSGGPQIIGPIIATAELYDPTTGKFSTTGDLITPRINATATLLPNGKVLVAGGWNTDTVETAELYDPATGKFNVTRPMVSGRNLHAAVGLPDGRVALLGGDHFEDGPQQSVEMYDYRADAYSQDYDFSPAGQMVEARSIFQATLLPDGRVLVAGGLSPVLAPNGFETVLSSVEIYDPATGQSTVTDHMADSRFFFAAATLADGRMLVAGGQHSNDPTDPRIKLSSAELIDPVTGKVSPTGAMTTGRISPAAVLLMDGRVLVVGGKSAVPSAEVYVP